MKSGSLKLLGSSGSVQACTGIVGHLLHLHQLVFVRTIYISFLSFRVYNSLILSNMRIIFFKFMGPCIANIFQYISNKAQLYTVYLWVRASQIHFNIYPTKCNFTQFIYIWKLLYMLRVVPPPIIRSAYNCIYSVWYLSDRYCYLPL
jgi:hypothetical protein